MQVDTRSVITVLVAVTVCVAFLATLLAPFFGVEIPQATQTFIMGLFTALVGGASSLQLVSIGQKQALVAQSMSKQ